MEVAFSGYLPLAYYNKSPLKTVYKNNKIKQHLKNGIIKNNTILSYY